MALQEVTKQNWVSQFTLWQANQKLGQQIQESKRNAAQQQPERIGDSGEAGNGG